MSFLSGMGDGSVIFTLKFSGRLESGNVLRVEAQHCNWLIILHIRGILWGYTLSELESITESRPEMSGK